MAACGKCTALHPFPSAVGNALAVAAEVVASAAAAAAAVAETIVVVAEPVDAA